MLKPKVLDFVQLRIKFVQIQNRNRMVEDSNEVQGGFA